MVLGNHRLLKHGEIGATVELPYIYYLGYEVIITNNNRNQVLDYKESDKGFIQVDLPMNLENVQIEVKYVGTTLTKISYVLMVVGGVVLVVIIVSDKNKKYNKNGES